MDFQTYANYREHGVKYYWSAGTSLSCLVLAASLLYIVIEYCAQSHLSTEDFDSAIRGLRMTQWFRRRTAWLPRLVRLVAGFVHKATFGLFESDIKVLVWDWRIRDERCRGGGGNRVGGQALWRDSEARAATVLGEDGED